MARDWTVVCKECGVPLLYSERSRAEALARGHSPPERCVKHRAEHSRAISRLAVKYLDMEPGIPLPEQGLKAGRFGRLSRPERRHEQVALEGFTPPPPDTFGIQDPEVVKLLEDMEDKQVAVIVAGTGSGKSTFLPWRLLVPPDPFPEDHLTRYGKIVVTQPRIEASTGIPQYVARTLHGSIAGPGTDIGYENSKNKDKSDTRNKLIYLTDGTLVNMIRKGGLHEVSVVVIDEAHERSLNIDLILALLRRELHGLPHLKVLIVSATINTDTFRDFFEPDFPVLIAPMKSKGIHPVHERWWAGPELPLQQWPIQMPARAAATVTEILRWMTDGTHPADIPSDVPAYQGDILVFLTGKRPIEEAIAATRELIEADPVLSKTADGIELLPLYGELSARKRDRPLNPATRAKRTKYRVVFSTNLAETSLTIDGIRHVVDTGLINRKSWDSATATESMEQVPHSRNGLRQRRGRAGRTHPGIWHCLYTEQQFIALDPDTPPEITRAPLPAVVLAAAVAGVADPRALTWLAPGPPQGEIDRARAALRAIGAINEAGDPTPVGRELATTRTNFDDAAILVAADQAGCAVEAATVLAAKSDECKNQLLRWSRRWPAAAKVYVDDVHGALLKGSVDDVDIVCRLWAGWEAQPDGAARIAWADRHFVDVAVMEAVDRQRRLLLEPLMAKTRTSRIRPLDLRLLSRLRAAIAWAHPNSLYIADRREPRDERKSQAGTLIPATGPRSSPDVVDAMHTAGRPVLDDESWVSRHRPPETSLLVLLDRQVRRRYTTPLAPPEKVLAATFCVVVAPELIYAGDDWLRALTRIPIAPVPRPVEAVPGDRFLADVLPTGGESRKLRLLAPLGPMPDPTVDIGDDEELDDLTTEDHDDELTGDVGGRAGAAEESLDLPPDPEDDEDDEDSVTFTIEPITPIPTVLPTAPVRLEDGLRDTIPSGTFEVIVVSVADDGTLVCLPDTRKDTFAAFSAQYRGQTVDLSLDHVRIFSRDRQPVLIARHRESGFSTPVDPRHIGTGLRYPQLRALQPGTTWSFELAAADEELMILELSQTERTLQALGRLTGDRNPFRTTGRVVDVYLDALFIEIAPDGDRLKPDDPPIVLRALARDLPQAADRIKVEATVSVVLTLPRPRGGVPVPKGFRAPPGPWEIHGSRLTITGALTVADWRRLTESSTRLPDPVEAARFRTQIATLAIRSLTPRLRVIDEQIFATAVAHGRVTVVVASLLDDGALRVSTPLGQRLIAAREANLFRSLGNGLAPGTSVEAFVEGSDAGLADLSVRLFDPAERGRLAVGTTVSVQLGSPTVRGAELHVSTLAGVAGLARVETLPSGYSEGDIVKVRVVEIPVTGPIRLSGRHEKYERQIPPQIGAVIQPGQRDRWDLRPLIRLAGDNCDIVCEGTPPEKIMIFSDETPEGRAGAHRLLSALNGEFWQIRVPNHQHLRAGKGAALRTITSRTGSVIIDGEQKDTRGRPERFVWVVAPSPTAAQNSLAAIRDGYPTVWVSTWFKRRGEAWQAATQAVKARSAWMRSNRDVDAAGKPIFQAVIECKPEKLDEILQAARQACPSIPITGGFQSDPALATTQIPLTQAPSPRPAPRLPTPIGTAQPLAAELPEAAPAARRERTVALPPRSVVAEGPTLTAAIASARAQLGVSDDVPVTYEVIDEGRVGLFGRVKRPMMVRVTLR